MRKTLIIPLALALAFAGCIQNMGDLKERLGTTAEEPVEPAAVTEEPAAPPAVNTTAPKPPVARITVFGPNGALIYKSTFTAEDPEAMVFVEESARLSLNGGDSEALETGATVTEFAWTLNGKPIEGDRAASVEVGEAGLYTLELVITDSVGSTDNQTLKLAVAPKPFEVVTELTTEPVAGAEGQGAASLPFTLALPGDKPATVQSVTFEARPGASCDAILEVLDSEGTSLGSEDSDGFGGAETIEAGALPLGDYTITVSPFACVAPEGVPVRIVVVYLPTIEGLAVDKHAH